MSIFQSASPLMVIAAEHRANNFRVLRSKMRRLPPIHQATLRAIVEHLAKVASHQDKNKMDPKNLAIVFGGVIFGDDDIPKGGDLLSVQPWKVSNKQCTMIRLLIFSFVAGHGNGGPYQ